MGPQRSGGRPLAESFLSREEWPQIWGPHMTRHVGWAWPGEENEQAVAGRRSSRAREAFFGQTSRIETAVGEPLLGDGPDDGTVNVRRDSGRRCRGYPVSPIEGTRGLAAWLRSDMPKWISRRSRRDRPDAGSPDGATGYDRFTAASLRLAAASFTMRAMFFRKAGLKLPSGLLVSKSKALLSSTRLYSSRMIQQGKSRPARRHSIWLIGRNSRSASGTAR